MYFLERDLPAQLCHPDAYFLHVACFSCRKCFLFWFHFWIVPGGLSIDGKDTVHIVRYCLSLISVRHYLSLRMPLRFCRFFSYVSILIFQNGKFEHLSLRRILKIPLPFLPLSLKDCSFFIFQFYNLLSLIWCFLCFRKDNNTWKLLS